MPTRLLPLLGLLAHAPPAAGLTIELRYDYDSQGFFDQPGAREAMRAVADFFEDILHDSLEPLIQSGSGNTWSATFSHPGTGRQVELPGRTFPVPADTLVVFVGARDLGGSTRGRGGPGGYRVSYVSSSWYQRVRSRGQTGALANPASDFGPWGGSISFDLDRDWHFQTDGRPTGSRGDFVSVAIHEMLHLLGFGTCDAFDALSSSGRFTGADARASWGGPVPLAADASHWRDDGACQYPAGYDPAGSDNVLSSTFGCFGRPHGLDQIAIMDPVSCQVGSLRHLQVATDLDLAALRDIGWQVVPPPHLDSHALGPDGCDFSWPTMSGLDYRLEQSRSLGDWITVAGPMAGDGGTQRFQDHVPSPGAAAFFRLRAEDPAQPALQSLRADDFPAHGSAERPPREVDGCGDHHHGS